MPPPHRSRGDVPGGRPRVGTGLTLRQSHPLLHFWPRKQLCSGQGQGDGGPGVHHEGRRRRPAGPGRRGEGLVRRYNSRGRAPAAPKPYPQTGGLEPVVHQSRWKGGARGCCLKKSILMHPLQSFSRTLSSSQSRRYFIFPSRYTDDRDAPYDVVGRLGATPPRRAPFPGGREGDSPGARVPRRIRRLRRRR